MSKKTPDLETGVLMGVTSQDIIQPLLLTPEGKAIMHREEEMLDRIEKMEIKVKSWVDGLLDLNERMRKVQGDFVEDHEQLEQLERDVKKGDTAWSKLECYRQAHEEYHKNLDARIDGIYAFMVEIKKYLDNQDKPKEGGWDDPGA